MSAHRSPCKQWPPVNALKQSVPSYHTHAMTQPVS